MSVQVPVQVPIQQVTYQQQAIQSSGFGSTWSPRQVWDSMSKKEITYISIILILILIVSIWQLMQRRTRLCLIHDLLLRVQDESLNNVDYVVFKQTLLNLDGITSRTSKRNIRRIIQNDAETGLTVYQAIMLQSLETNNAGTLFATVRECM